MRLINKDLFIHLRHIRKTQIYIKQTVSDDNNFPLDLIWHSSQQHQFNTDALAKKNLQM